MKNSEIENIILKKIIEGLESQEQQMLDKWLAESHEHRKTYEAYTQLWDKSKNLVLSDSIDVEASLKHTKKRIDLKTSNKWLIYLRQAAAVLILSVAISSLYNNIQRKVPEIAVSEREVYQEITASYGTRTKLMLADGTNVWLNSGSSLKFPISFSNSKKREVKLNGEGYFEVKTDSTKPFIVNTSKLDIMVYGTSFNVMSYESQNEMTVALTEGKVSVMKRGTGKNKELAILKPNDVVIYNQRNNKIIQQTDHYIEKYTAWKDGQIIFYGDPIDVVVRRLEKRYNVDINVADKELRKYRFTATFIDESLDQVLKLLSLSSSMDYKIVPAKKMQNNTFSKRKVVLNIRK